jgi:hypothetical protein
MILLSERGTVIQTAQQALAIRRITPIVHNNPHQVLSLTNGQRELLKTHTIAIDLDAPHIRSQAEALAKMWRDPNRPWSVVLLLLSLRATEEEVAILGRVSNRHGCLFLVKPADTSLVAWEEVMQRSAKERLFLEIRHDLLATMILKQATIVEQERVLKILEAAPHIRKVQDYCRQHGVERRSLWRRMRGHEQRSTGDLLYCCRLLWIVKLRSLGWAPGEIARFMSYTDLAEASRRMGARLQLKMSQIAGIKYETMLECFIDVVLKTNKNSLPAFNSLGRLICPE